MAERKRGKNVHLSKADQHRYLKQIREAAETGDVLAMGLMVIATKLEQLSPEPAAKSGWRGEAGDPHDEIVSAIRKNNPGSEQLPKSEPKVR